MKPQGFDVAVHVSLFLGQGRSRCTVIGTLDAVTAQAQIVGIVPVKGDQLQFTSPRFTGVVQAAGVRISMDGRGRWMDNVFIERLWRSLKYECVYLHAFETGSELRAGLTKWIGYYNANRPHSRLGGQTPDEAYGLGELMRLAA